MSVTITSILLFGLLNCYSQLSSPVKSILIPVEVLENSVGRTIDSSWVIQIRLNGNQQLATLKHFMSKDETLGGEAVYFDTLTIRSTEAFFNLRIINSLRFVDQGDFNTYTSTAPSVLKSSSALLRMSPFIVVNTDRAFLLVDNHASGEGRIYELVRKNFSWRINNWLLYYIY